MNKINVLKQRCLLDELSKHIDTINISSYNAYQLTKNSSVESFEYKKKYFALLRCNGVAIMLVSTDGYGTLTNIRRLCAANNVNSLNAKAIKKFCLRMRYKTYVNNNKLYAPKWNYIKEELLNYTVPSTLGRAICEM